MSFCVACQSHASARPCEHCGAEPRLDGRYTLLGLLGAGATSTTWRAEGPDGEVAIKELSLRRVRTPKARELVDREIRVLSELALPSVPRLREVVETGRGRSHTLWLVMDLAPGLALHKAFDGPASETRVLAIIEEVAGTLGALHALRPAILHRDVKPQNLILHPDGQRVTLVDFGSVRDVVRDPGQGSTIVGTFGYLAPEQLLGDAVPASDFYGLGATAVHLLLGGPPHGLLDRDGHLRWRDGVHVSVGTATLLDALLHPDPAERLSDATQVIETAEWVWTLRSRRARPSAVPRPRRGPSGEAAPPRELRGLVQRMGSEDFGPAEPQVVDEAFDELLEDPLPEATAVAPTRPPPGPSAGFEWWASIRMMVVTAVCALVALVTLIAALGVVGRAGGFDGVLPGPGPAHPSPPPAQPAPVPAQPAPVPVQPAPPLQPPVTPSPDAIHRSLVDLQRSVGSLDDACGIGVRPISLHMTPAGDILAGRSSALDACVVGGLGRQGRSAPWPLATGETWVLPPPGQPLSLGGGELRIDLGDGQRRVWDPHEGVAKLAP